MAVFLKLDVTDPEQLVRAVSDAERQLGPVTILVSNADAERAIQLPLGLVIKGARDQRAGALHLLLRGGGTAEPSNWSGRIVNIAWVKAHEYDGSGAAMYSHKQEAVVRMTEALFVEWARFHINVNAITPGAFGSR